MIKNVIIIDKQETVLKACNIYRDKKIGCLIVIEHGNCIGIFTERDLKEHTICEHRNPETTKIEEIMSLDIKTIHALETIEKAI